MKLFIFVFFTFLCFIFDVDVGTGHVDLAIIPAAIAAGASLIGNIFGGSNTKSTNKTNLKIAQMNNEYNKAMFDQQIQYNWDMWNAQNEYNTASAQRQRLEDAGLNPYLMMNGGDAGTAQGGNAVNPPSAQAVQMQPFTPDTSGIVNAALQYDQQRFLADEQYQKTRIAEQTADQLQADNTYKEEKAMLNLLKMMHEEKDMFYKAGITKNQLEFMTQTFWHRVSQEYSKDLLEQKEVDFKQSAIDYNRIQSTLMEHQIKNNDAITLAQIQEILSSAARNNAEKERAISDILVNMENVEGGKISNKVARRTATSLIFRTNAENWARSYDALNSPYQNRSLNTATGIIGTLLGFGTKASSILHGSFGNATDAIRLAK